MVESYWNEKWEVVGSSDYGKKKSYAISNYGRFVSFDNDFSDGVILKGGMISGYKSVGMRYSDGYKSAYIHQLVAKFFLNKPASEKMYVIHIDFNKLNNHVDNLKWVTLSEKVEHQKKHPLMQKFADDNRNRFLHQGHKLSSNDVFRLKKKIFDPNRKTRVKMLAKQFGISEMQVYRIKIGENWGHIRVPNEPVRDL